MLEQVIFSIDDVDNIRTLRKFLHHVDVEVIMGRMSHVAQGIGCYKGEMEICFMAQARDMPRIADWIKNQESTLHVPGDVRQPCTLEFLSDGSCEKLGPMRRVSWDEAKELDGWTFMNGVYWACSK